MKKAVLIAGILLSLIILSGAALAEDCVCTDVYEPVCGVDKKTYGNECNANCAGIEIAYKTGCSHTCEDISCTLTCPYGVKADEYGCKLCECNEISCAGEGMGIAVIPNPPSCCEGLNQIPPKSGDLLGISGICTAKCGNGNCDTGTETNYNCPEDCQPVPCKNDGEDIPVIENPPVCCEGLRAEPIYDRKGVSAICKKPTPCIGTIDEQGCKVVKCDDGRYERNCPTTPTPVTCEKQEDPATKCVIKKCSDGYIDRWCPTQPTECKTYIDEKGCKVTSCADGTRRDCPTPAQEECTKYVREDGCVVKKCKEGAVMIDCPTSTVLPASAVPTSCIEVRDESGNVVSRQCQAVAVNEVPIFTTACPTDEDNKRKIEACRLSNGNPFTEASSNGCKVINCRMATSSTTSGDATPAVATTCPGQPIEEIRKIKDDCKQNAGEIIVKFDGGGCEKYYCIKNWEQDCRKEKDIPAEKKDSCEKQGGQFILKTNEKGCITFIDCITTGQSSYASSEIKKTPDVAELTDLAFKLESLKIEFEGLGKKADGIAAYYEENGNEADANRFKRVAGMLYSAKDKIDEIKNMIRENLDNFDESMAREVKDSIRYIKEILLKDILYIMLGGEGKAGETCKNISCFERALRACLPTTITVSEGGKEMEINILGVEDNLCKLEAKTGDESGTYEMICKIPDFSMIGLGQFKPEKYCEGTLLDYMAGSISPKTSTSNQIQAPLEGPELIIESVKCVFNNNASGTQKCYDSTGAYGCANEPKRDKRDYSTMCTPKTEQIKVGERIAVNGGGAYEGKTLTINLTDTTATNTDETTIKSAWALKNGDEMLKTAETIRGNTSSQDDLSLIFREYIATGTYIRITGIVPTGDKYAVTLVTTCETSDYTSCTAEVKGAKGTKLTWKSTCGGYAYTTVDGENEYAEFKCGFCDSLDEAGCEKTEGCTTVRISAPPTGATSDTGKFVRCEAIVQ
ncbi:MAG: hypothetical protein NTZ73_01825 [Candidatus Diapherotrites archaeon]|nr:hypothetical protein [Candidatus Diapherotrites archaeon]